MADNDKRGNDRIASTNLISYVCTDQDNEAVENGMGRTLNVSESGILLETHKELDADLRILLSIGLEDNLIDIEGKVVYSQPDEKGKYNVGIKFTELDKETEQQLSEFIKAFKRS